MRKYYSMILSLMMLFLSLPLMAQLEDHKGEGFKVTTAATNIEAGKWYVMKNPVRKAYAYSQGLGKNMMAGSLSDIPEKGGTVEAKAGYLVRFAAVEGVADAYTIQTGLGDYWNELTKGSNNSTVASDAMYFQSGHIGDNADYFWFQGNNGAMTLDCNEIGGTVAGWGTDIPTATTGNNAWQVMNVEFIDASQIATATVNYTYKVDEDVVYSYTRTIQDIAPTEVTFEEPLSIIGSVCTDSVPAAETIEANKTYDITYTYTVDPGALPFVPAQIEGEGTSAKFAEGTKWYYLKPQNASNSYCYVNDEEGVSARSTEVVPADLYTFFTFTGTNPFAGFQIHAFKQPASSALYTKNSGDEDSDVYFSSEGAQFLLKAGSYAGQFRFNLKDNDNSYLDVYKGAMELYTHTSWAATDDGAQYEIVEVSEEALARAIRGTIEVYDDPSSVQPASGSVFRNGATLDTIRVEFTEELALAKEKKDIILLNADGDTVATPAYSILDNESILKIEFTPGINTPGNYTLVIPQGTFVSKDGVKDNSEVLLHYACLSAFNDTTVTARIWKTDNIFSTLPFEDGKDYYNVKIKISSQDHITLLDWENSQSTSNDLDLTFDASKTSNNGLSVNGDTSSPYWLTTKVISDDGYYGFWLYRDYSDFSMNEEYGKFTLCCYSYEAGDYVDLTADWYMDDRYNPEKVLLQGKVWNKPIKEFVSEDNIAWSQLPYGEDGTYDVEVKFNGAGSMTIKGYTGTAGEDQTITFDTESGNVLTINGQTPDEYYSVWVNSDILDGIYGGYYAYGNDYSYVYYNSEKQWGYAALLGYDYNVDDYRYLFVTFGEEPEPEPEAIKARIYNTPIMGYDGEAWSQLPYGEDGSYEIEVREDGENQITLLGYTGVSGENQTLTLDGEGHVLKINNKEADEYGTVWLTSTVLDGSGYNGFYEYPYDATSPETSSYAAYDPETKSGYAVLLGYDWSVGDEGDYRYMYILIGETATGVENVAAPNATANRTQKVIEGGRLYILKDGKKYTPSGQLVK